MNTISNPENGLKSRVFIALPILEPTISEINTVLQDFPGNKIHPSKWHITLEFIEKLSEEKLKQLFTIFNIMPLPNPFEITFQSLGAFPSPRHAGILWLGVEENQTLMTLSETIKNRLSEAEFILESRPLLPHLSLSRFKRAENISHWLAKKILPKVTCKVERISLFQSIISDHDSKYIELLHRIL